MSPQPLRVGLLCPYSLSVNGGVQVQVLELGRSLRKMGVQTQVLGPCDGPPPEAWVTPLGSSIPTSTNGSMAPLAPDLPASLRTISALRAETFDVVHLHEPMAPGACLTALLFSDRPMVGTFHRSGNSGWLTATGIFHRQTVGRLRAAVSVSEAARRTALASYHRDSDVLWNGVDTEGYASAPPWPTDGPTVLFIGRHEPRKGLGVLLEAFASLDRPDVRLWVAGEGPETPDLHRRFGGDQRISWLGAVPEAEKRSRLRGADVFCAPSLGGESFGIVLTEALAAGAAVVASDITGYRDVVRDGVEGTLVSPGEVGALARALDAALSGSYPVMTLAGHRRAEELSMTRLAERYVEIYRRVMSLGGPR